MAQINRDRIENLRREMRREGMDWYIVPTDDYHISEYVGDYFKSRAWLSGFNGSAGVLLVGLTDAYLWTDGRYFLQAAAELKDSGVTLMKQGEPGVPDIDQFLKKNAKGKTIGYDGKTMSFSFGQKIKNALRDSETLYITDLDLVNRVWVGRPKMSEEKIFILGTEYAGRTVAEKLIDLRNELIERDCDAILIPALDEVAWLFNFRGNDVLYTPVALSYAIVTKYSAILYISENALDGNLLSYFEMNGITVKNYFKVYEDVFALKGKTLVDPNSTNELLISSLPAPVFAESPVRVAKATKNATELENIRIAHLKDGIALTKAIYWLKKSAENGEIYNETEMSVAEKWTEFRKAQGDVLELSFDSIVATGDHSPVIHYEPTPETDRKIQEGFLLLDTGAQYLQGTTDVTRTVSIGKVDRKMKLRYTAVLKGHLDLAMAKFPVGTLGNSLDAIARRPIWDIGLDYNHGTGHGVGYLLGVHEGPNCVRRMAPGAAYGLPLKSGMVTSDEPGIYLEGEYGIRIENLFVTVPVENYPNFLTFDMLTLVPYDRESINFFDLSEEEMRYLESYNRNLLEKVGPFLTEDELAWLKEEVTF
ncbi:MAG: aminopeptidase P family protein [Clostridia bacterium]|nr:aminopeptidase P family protein [Clostridia bacterium]